MPTLEQLRQTRIQKLNRLKNNGINPYPAKTKRSSSIESVVKKFRLWNFLKKEFYLVGRIRNIRTHGKATFFDIEDGSGKIQCFVSPADLAVSDKEKLYDMFLTDFDIGDFIEVVGTLFKTKKGEKTVKINSLKIITKALRPLPEKWHGLKDIEERYRKRYLDLLMNPEVKIKFLNRSKIIREIRDFLNALGFIEFETPVLQPIPGGATAKPFKTHLNAMDMDLYLRIAPELYLKRLLIGGFEKIYEIGKNFRNEGIDRDHNPEFTTLELYWAYKDYNELMKFVEDFMMNLWKKYRPGETWQWEKKTFATLFTEHTGKNFDDINPDELDEIYKKEIRAPGKIKKTTLVIDYPESLMQLAKIKKDNKFKNKITESFQLIAGTEDTGMEGGSEILKGFSELNDPEFQREQMERQEKLFRNGKEESSRLDEDFLESLEYGMPPAAGFGLGLDRLVMLLTKSHAAREIILFPMMKPKE